jgi:hypothetical protein
MRKDGKVDITRDSRWEEGVRVWKAVRAADLGLAKPNL